MIICVTPNPGVEHTVRVQDFKVGAVNRTSSVIAYTGGKGFNGARSIRMLGGDYLSLSIAGGHSGEWIKEMTRKEGLRAEWTTIDNDVRVVMIVVNLAGDGHDQTGVHRQEDATVINEEGPTLSHGEWQRFVADAMTLAKNARYVSLCGSLPGATPAEYLGEMTAVLEQRDVQVWIDNRGKALELALPHKPTGVKFNGKEAATLLDGREIRDVATAWSAARTLRQQRGLAHVNITLGELGAVMVNDEGAWHVQPPRYQPVNSAGSGDAFLGGLLYGLDQDLPMPDALRIAAAAGAANALTELAGQVFYADFARALQETRVIVLENRI